VIDGQSGILLPGFVDAHMHLDKTFWGLPWRPHQAGSSVLDRIENERRLRRELGLAPDAQAERLALQAIGCRADFVVVPGETLGEPVVAQPTRAWVVSAGRVIARDGHCTL
jgi:cytosine/adenosine deaminase-related metal-dependent hydrolase